MDDRHSAEAGESGAAGPDPEPEPGPSTPPRAARFRLAIPSIRGLRGRLPAIGGVAVFVTWGVIAVVGSRGMLDVRQHAREHAELEAAVAERAKRVEELRDEVHRLEQRDGTARERIAREQLGYARKGEVVFVLPSEAEPREPAAPTADPAEPAP